MKRNLLKAAVLAIGGTIALASSPVMAQEAKSLDELLQMVKQGRASDAREQKAREQRFKNARYDQQKMLKEAEKTLADEEKRSSELENTFEENETVLTEMSEYASVPVINGLTDRTHPCQIMADIQTFEEHRGPIKGKKVVWTGDGNNVCASFLHAAGQFGFDFTFTGPSQFDPEEEFMGFARQKGSKVVIERDAHKAVEGADLVVADTWVSMHDAQSAKERRHNMLRPYQVNAELMSHAKPDALFMHCLPAHREEEATSEVMDGPNSVIFDEAENRLHAQKAIMRWCLGA